MWNFSDIRDNHRYFLALTQLSTGRRRVVLCDVDEARPDAALFTEVLSNELLLTRDLERISEQAPLLGGGRFFVDAHGVWLTEEEMCALEDDKDDYDVPWLNGIPPVFAPR